MGSYFERAPPPAVRDSVRCLWLHRVDSEDAPLFDVLPDACVDLVWRDGTLHVAGPDRRVFRETLRPGESIVGLRFRPGAASRWLRAPLDELADRRLPLREVWKEGSERLGAALAPTVDAAEALAALGEGAVRLAAALPPADGRIEALVRTLRGTPESSLGALARRLGWSERTLRRRCLEVFGYGPRTLRRILRLQRLLAGGLPRAGLALAALDAGYADQAHMSREVRALTGRTAQELGRDRGTV